MVCVGVNWSDCFLTLISDYTVYTPSNIFVLGMGLRSLNTVVGRAVVWVDGTCYTNSLGYAVELSLYSAVVSYFVLLRSVIFSCLRGVSSQLRVCWEDEQRGWVHVLQTTLCNVLSNSCWFSVIAFSWSILFLIFGMTKRKSIHNISSSCTVFFSSDFLMKEYITINNTCTRWFPMLLYDWMGRCCECTTYVLCKCSAQLSFRFCVSFNVVHIINYLLNSAWFTTYPEYVGCFCHETNT